MPAHSSFYVAFSLNEYFSFTDTCHSIKSFLNENSPLQQHIFLLIHHCSHGSLKKMEELLPVAMGSRIFHKEYKDNLMPLLPHSYTSLK